MKCAVAICLTLLVLSLGPANAQWGFGRRRFFGRPFFGGFGRPFYGGFGRPFLGGFGGPGFGGFGGFGRGGGALGALGLLGSAALLGSGNPLGRAIGGIGLLSAFG